jgi:tellurite resistance protein TehA-like permease
MADTNGSTSTQLGDQPDSYSKEPFRDEEASNTIPPTRPILSALIQDFSPVWFTWCMNTGILSALMHTLPYQFSGLRTISAILYLTDLTLFVLFSGIFALRFYFYRGTAWAEISSDVNELCFTATLPISWMTLTTLTSLIASNASWGGHHLTLLAVSMWWIGVGWTMLVAVAVYSLLTRHSLTSTKTLTLSIILPAVATATVAAEGALICIYSSTITPRLAIPIIITSFMLLGIGLLIAMLIYALFLQRMLDTDWFDGVRRPTLILLLGPAGQSATAFLALATACRMHFPNYERGTFLTAPAAEALGAACVLLALLVFGFGVFWSCYGVYGIADALARKEAKWTPVWYSTIFPAGESHFSLPGSALLPLLLLSSPCIFPLTNPKPKPDPNALESHPSSACLTH